MIIIDAEDQVASIEDTVDAEDSIGNTEDPLPFQRRALKGIDQEIDH